MCMREENYINGRRDGKIKEWHLNGKLQKETDYKKGEIHGIMKKYNKLGKLIYKAKYKKNRLIKVIMSEEQTK